MPARVRVFARVWVWLNLADCPGQDCRDEKGLEAAHRGGRTLHELCLLLSFVVATIAVVAVVGVCV